jgi:hypothetical protein
VDKLLIAMWIAWERTMKRTSKVLRILPVVAAFNSFAARAETPAARCVADLARVDAQFCIGPAGTNLTYRWQANDPNFDLVANACVGNNDGLGNRSDLIFALDRSQNIWGLDAQNKKLGADQIATLKAFLEKLRTEAQAEPGKAPKVGVVMFSNDASCTAYSGGSIAVNRSFPCLYVKAASLADDAQYNLISGFLKEADGKYAQGGAAATSDYAIPAGLAAANSFGLASSRKAGLVIMSDGRAYKGAVNDPYAYLRIQNYTQAQASALNAFSVPAMKGYNLVFALNPIKPPAFDDTHTDAFDTMCALADANKADCGAPTVVDDPRSWPVNKLDPKAFVGGIAGATSFDLNDKPSFEAAMEKLRITATGSATVTAVAYRVDGGDLKPGKIDGQRVTVPGLVVGQDQKLEVVLTAGTAQVSVPVAITTDKVASQHADFQDKEMFCAAEVAPATEGPKLRLKDLQGGSGSCGTVPGDSTERNALALIALLLLPLLVVARKKTLAPVAALLALVAGTAKAEDSKGLNTLNYRPVVDGIATSEKAQTPEQGRFNAGLYMDYANDAVELSGDKGKRLGSVADNQVTAHVAADVGVFKNAALGLHLPFVYKTDLSRRLDGGAGNGEKSSELSDPAVTFKYTIVSQKSLAFAVMPMATIPTGKPENLTGDGAATFGAFAVLSGAEGNLGWAANLGYMHRQKAVVFEDERAHSVSIKGQFETMLGLDYKVLPILNLGGGLQFKPAYGERIDFTRANPAEWTMVAKLKPTGGALETQAGFGTGLGKGIGSPDYRVYAGVAYVK